MRKSHFLQLGFAALLGAPLGAAVKLPALISDHMVLQRGVPVRIWGSADPGEEVRVEFQGQNVSTRAGARGKWVAWLKPLVTAGPLEMVIAGSNTVVLKDVLVGEVWVASGQSNMGFRLSGAINSQDEIARANFPLLHLFQVKLTVADQPAEDVVGSWRVCAPDNAGSFSAVGYFFGRNLHQALHVPLGMIESDWGGTPAQSWTNSLPAWSHTCTFQNARWPLASGAPPYSTWMERSESTRPESHRSPVPARNFCSSLATRIR